jgi:hypothetical protein
MHLSLALFVSTPTLGDHLENLVLLGCGLLILVVALALCSYLLNKLSRACSASADWLDGKATRRQKRRRTCLKKHYAPPARHPHLRAVPPPPADDSLARNALHRNAEAYHHRQASSARDRVQMRLVKPRDKF